MILPRKPHHVNNVVPRRVQSSALENGETPSVVHQCRARELKCGGTPRGESGVHAGRYTVYSRLSMA